LDPIFVVYLGGIAFVILLGTFWPVDEAERGQMTGLIARIKDAYQNDWAFLAVVAVLAFLVIAISHASIWLMRVG
jgi:hypothetical protein